MASLFGGVTGTIGFGVTKIVSEASLFRMRLRASSPSFVGMPMRVEPARVVLTAGVCCASNSVNSCTLRRHLTVNSWISAMTWPVSVARVMSKEMRSLPFVLWRRRVWLMTRAGSGAWMVSLL